MADSRIRRLKQELAGGLTSPESLTSAEAVHDALGTPKNVKDLLTQLTLEEKVGLLSGFDYWHTKSVERLGIPALSMADGPHGLRKQKENELGIDKSYPATCFPTAALLACSWDEELAERQGAAIGKEARALGLSCVLGPGINIKRSPLCGRNFEYFSEDPLLSGRMGAGIVNGLQSRGVSACLKHFAVNNQEDYRFWVDAKVDYKTLREIYLASFEYALMFSKPKAIMCSYNKINGMYASENRWLLTDILRKEWGYDGIVISDWGAVNNRTQGVWAGLDLEMPGSFGVNDKEILKALGRDALGEPFIAPTDSAFDNKLTEEEIDICVERMLKFIFSLEETVIPVSDEVTPGKDGHTSTDSAHHELAREIAAESMVLLENNGILPLKKGINVAVVGDMAINPVYQGGGSSRIVPTKVDIPLDCIGEYSNATYITDVEKESDVIKNADAVIVFTGIPDGHETEGSDRKNMKLPPEYNALIKPVVRLNPKTAVVICAGAPVQFPIASSYDLPALLMAYLGGQAMGGAVADLLFGVKIPCGKLAESFPMRIENTSAFFNFPGDGISVNYAEGTHVGYRWHNKVKRKPKYEFGYGLSYTEFRHITVGKNDKRVGVRVFNIGNYDGKEVVQIYEDGELRGFKKVFVKKGESVDVTVEKIPKIKYTVPVNIKVTMYTQVKALYHIPNGMGLLKELGEKFGMEITEELVNTRDCSSFVGNILRNMVTMFDLGWTFEDLQARIDKINKLNGII
jgi:beta-glucosidase